MTTPELITELLPNEVFVFGSNLAGIHGAGAAKWALKFGAKRGKGWGILGQTYALPTKDKNIQTLRLYEIKDYVSMFLDTAKDLQNSRFLVTPVGCGLAGYTPADIAPMFVEHPGNVILPASFIPFIYK